MLEILAKIAFVLLAIIGAAEIVRNIIFWMLRPSRPGKLYLVVSLEGHDEGAEMLLESAIERLKWIRGDEKMLICLDNGMDEETNVVCRIISNRNPGVEVCTPEELPDILCQ